MRSTSRVEINLTAIERNMATVRRALAAGSPGRNVEIAAVLKADAYGLGAVRVGKRLEAVGASMIAVFTPTQARALIDAAIACPVLILMPVRELPRTDSLYRAAAMGRLHLTVHEPEQLEALAHTADQLGLRLPLHVQVDTGMSHCGAGPARAEPLVERIAEHRRLHLAGMMTHFADSAADAEFTRQQAERFDAWLARVRPHVPDDCVIHHANTCAVFRSADHHRDMVRIGLALFGFARERVGDPEACELLHHADELEPAVRWTSAVSMISNIEAGAHVGYARTWRADRPTRLAVVPVGYADGYPLALSNKGAVGIATSSGAVAWAPVVGRVSMDQLTVDITDLPQSAVQVGSSVELFGSDRSAPNFPPSLAESAGTITHELLARLSSRIPRVYHVEETHSTQATAPSRAMNQ